MRVGSLCSGYGGYEMALAALFDDVELAWYAENNPGASRVMAHHYPGITNYEDLTAVDWETVPPVDVITAGFPCQPLSTAGQRKGTEDERWLFDDIAGAIGILRPRLVLLENVTGILTLGGTLVVGSLTQLGYDCRWTVVRAADAGAPHRRARWFCVATDAEPGDTDQLHDDLLEDRRPASTDSDGERCEERDSTAIPAREGHVAPAGSGVIAADTGSERHGGGQDGREVGLLDSRDESEARQQQRPRAEPVNRGTATPTDSDDIGPERPGGTRRRRSGLADEGVATAHPESAERRPEEHAPVDSAIGPASEPGECDRQAATDPDGGGLQSVRPEHRLGEEGREAGAAGSGDDPASTNPDDEGLQGCRGEHELREDSQEAQTPWGDYDSAIRRWGSILGRPAPAPADARGLSPLFVEWMMGLPEGHVTGVTLSRTDELKMLGNGIVPQQAMVALWLLLGLGEA